MSGETEFCAIPVTAEWALWGKEPQDLEYRLLRSSDDGILSAANFDELLTRYATGTPEVLPQVTISWLEDRHQGHQIALSIHEEPDDRRTDATGRKVVLTRCFCVPYTTLAEGLVSYQAMYDVFRKIPLSERRGTIKTSLPVMQPGSLADRSVVRAAALLMTRKPVCVLEADRVGLSERLRFIDSVMSLLPYGLRCQLSASTWASSVFWEHKFRLFFSSARRPDDKYDVIWDGDTRPPEHPEAWEYWNWLEGDAPDLVDQLGRRAGQLARETDPVTFRADDVGKLLGRLYKLSDGPRRRPRPPMPPPEPPPGERGGRTIEKLLIDCDRMRGTDHFLLRVAVRQLADRRHDKATAEEQDRYRGIIKEHRLLQEHKALDSSLQAELYAAVLGIAFEIPLDYEGYCQLEACAGLVPGQQMHRSLLRAVGKAGTDDLCTKLLVADGDGTISREKASSAELIEAVADRRLDVEHRRVIYETAVGELAAQARGQRFDWQLLRSALAEHAYLEPVLERIYRVPEVRLTSLRRLLKLAYGEVLTRADVHAVLSAADHPPSGDLFFAAVSMADRGDAEFAERRFIRELARGYHADTRGIFYRLFPEYDLRDDGDESPHPAWGSADVQHGLKQRITSWGQSKKPGSHAGPRPPVSQVPASRQRTDRPAPGPGLGPGLRINWVRVAYFLGALTMVFILTGLLVLFQVL